MAFVHSHILSIILFTPLAGLIVSLFIPGENKSAVRWWANIVMFVSFLVSLPLVVWFTHEAPARAQRRNRRIRVGVDLFRIARILARNSSSHSRSPYHRRRNASPRRRLPGLGFTHSLAQHY